MKERYDDEKMYSDDDRFFGPIVIRNYKEVLNRYAYSRYEGRFRARAGQNRLAPSQRPKLHQNQFAALMKQLSDSITSCGEEKLLEDERNVKAAHRLLIYEDFNEDEAHV